MRILLFFFLLHLTSTITPETYIGKWQIEGGSIIEIYKNDNLFFGKIYKRTKNPTSNLNGLDNKNPDKNLKKRTLLGMDILNNLRFTDDKLSGGTIYNADSGKTYDVKLWVDEDDLNTCYIRAYKGILFKTFRAKKIR